MNDDHRASCDRDTLLENFAAELTSAAYSVALRQGMTCPWIEMELALWRGLAETVRQWTWERPPTGSPDESKLWWQGLLVALTAEAFRVARRHRVRGPHLEMEWYLYRALRSVIEGRAGRAPV